MEKRVDIAIIKGGKPVAGVAIKFIMSNYRQNSNNYFENMLGETANIRTNNILYFQIVKEKGAELKFSELKDEQQILDSKVFFEDALIFNDYQGFIRKCSHLIEGYF